MLIIYFLGAVLLAVLDQLSKLAVLQFLKPVTTIPILEGIFHLTYCENRGAAFGILQGRFGLLFVITALVVLVVTVYMIKRKPKNPLLVSAITLLIGGALGNLIDRVFRGFVVDFLDFALIHFPVFNLADCFVVVGAVLLIFYVLFFDTDKLKKESEEIQSE